MIRGLYTSAMGMISQMQRMDVVSNNIANVDTVSFKRDHVVSHAFSDMLMLRINDPGVRLFQQWPIGRVSPGVFVDDVHTDFAQGSLRQTGSPLHMAIHGPGFFVVSVDGEELFTRDGSFTMFHGMLLTTDGARVQGLNGDIILPHGEIVIGDNGRIYVDGEYVDTLQMVGFENMQHLRKMQDNLFRPTEDAVRAAFQGQIRQGFLENSNINSVAEMVQLINLSRAFEINSNMITIQDQTLQRAANDIVGR